MDYKKLKTEITKFGEIKGIMGGSTTMQGYVSPNLKGTYGLARNVDNNGNMINPERSKVGGSVMPIGNKWWTHRKSRREKSEHDRSRMISRFDDGSLKRYFIHLCEGIDENIHKEFENLEKFDLVRKQIVGIHSTALHGKDWDAVAKSGMKIVWSPLSNLILYNKTTDIKGALDHGVPLQHISFAPDWAPSGSPSMLFEAKVVNEYSKKKLGGILTPKKIVSMMTENPAIISSYQDYIGKIKKGMRADITVLKKKDKSPYKSVLNSFNQDVNLVMVDGQPIYGNAEYFKKLNKGNDYEMFEVNGVKKALDITDPEIPNDNMTFKQLMTLLIKEFKEAKAKIPFAYGADVNNYAKLAPLFWPKYTSYENIMYLSAAGKGSAKTDENANSEFRNSKIGESYNREAKSEYRELKNQLTPSHRRSGKRRRGRRRGKSKYSNRRNYQKEDYGKSIKGQTFTVTTEGLGSLGDAFVKIGKKKVYIKGCSEEKKKVKIIITRDNGKFCQAKLAD